MADYLIKNAEMLKMPLLLQILSYSHQIWTQGPPMPDLRIGCAQI